MGDEQKEPILSNLLNYRMEVTMILSTPRERQANERRVALTPDAVGRLVKAGHTVRVETNAGQEAGFLDEAYRALGAEIHPQETLYNDTEIVARVQRPEPEELKLTPAGAIVIGFLEPLGHPDYVDTLAKAKVTAFSMEAIPRTTRAQSMDALSSQSNIAGYKSVIVAAEALPRFFPMMTTAAGTVPPAKVLVLGAGVAGLQAIATARRLGAVVTGFDTRAAVKEQVKSLGAHFLELDLGVEGEGTGGYAKELATDDQEKQRRALVAPIGASDVVITTAQIPGKPAPLLIIEDAVKAMKPGSVIVDLAASTGGNCALTVPGQTVVREGVTIIGATNLPASVPRDASQLYSRNVLALLGILIDKKGEINLDFNDEIIAGACLTYNGEVLHKASRIALGLPEGVSA
jgi:NAD(P) transhydrogenase subunit alpha